MREIPTARANPIGNRAPGGIPASHDERHRRNLHSLLGAKLAAEAVGFPARVRKSIRRYGPSSHCPQGRRLKTGRSPTMSWSLSTTPSSGKWASPGKAGNIQGKLDPRGNIFEGPRRREYPDAGAAQHRVHRSHGRTRHGAWAGIRFIRPPRSTPSRAINVPAAPITDIAAAGGCHVNAKSSTAVTTIPAALATKNLTIFDLAHVTRIVADSNGRVTGVSYMRNREEFFQPAKVVLLARIHLRKLAPAAAFEVGSVSQRSGEQSRPGGQALFCALPNRGDRRYFLLT